MLIGSEDEEVKIMGQELAKEWGELRGFGPSLKVMWRRTDLILGTSFPLALSGVRRVLSPRSDRIKCHSEATCKRIVR